MRFTLCLVGSCLLAGLATSAGAQQSPPVLPRPIGTLAVHSDLPARKNPGDVDTVNHLAASLYDVISGPAGKARDWERFRSLFLHDGRLGVVVPESAETSESAGSRGDVIFVTPDAYTVSPRS